MLPFESRTSAAQSSALWEVVVSTADFFVTLTGKLLTSAGDAGTVVFMHSPKAVGFGVTSTKVHVPLDGGFAPAPDPIIPRARTAAAAVTETR
jgi:hypothetical protein